MLLYCVLNFFSVPFVSLVFSKRILDDRQILKKSILKLTHGLCTRLYTYTYNLLDFEVWNLFLEFQNRVYFTFGSFFCSKLFNSLDDSFESKKKKFKRRYVAFLAVVVSLMIILFFRSYIFLTSLVRVYV